MQTARDVWSWTVRHHCGAQGPECETEAAAIAAWNTRAHITAQQAARALRVAILKALEEVEVK